jgi:hypothetical protein
LCIGGDASAIKTVDVLKVAEGCRRVGADKGEQPS